MRVEASPVDREQHLQVVNTAVLDRQASVHVGFGGREFRIEKKFAFDLVIVEADGDVGPVDAAAEGVPAAVMPDDGQASFFDKAPQQVLQKKHAFTSSGG